MKTNKSYEPIEMHRMTAYGEIVGISLKDGERYYFCLASDGCVSLMPADVVDNAEGNIEKGRKAKA